MGGGLREQSLFVSYSHKDRDLVLSLLGIVPVVWHAAFIDFLHTPRGSNWLDDHNYRIESSDRVLLCWSVNAARSKHVEREWKHALTAGSIIVPILLDNTTLPNELASIHAISLQDLVQVEGVFFENTQVKERLTNEVIHGLQSEIRRLSTQTKDEASYYGLASRHSEVVLGSAEFPKPPSAIGSTLMDAFRKAEEELRRAREIAQAEFYRQRRQQQREEADRRGVVRAFQFRSGAVKCPICHQTFSIEKREEPRCPDCQTLLEPSKDYPIEKHLGHRLLGDQCVDCGSSLIYVEHFKPRCV